jgi:predicted kinase
MCGDPPQPVGRAHRADRAGAQRPEAVVLCGIQASGKTSFYVERFLHTHVRVSLDLLRTRHREARLLEVCLETRQRFVVDGTNPTADERRRYVQPARAAGFRVVGFFVDLAPAEALARNALRPPARRIPVAGLLGTRKRFELPRAAEGFEAVHRARSLAGGGFAVEPLELAVGLAPTRPLPHPS